MAESVSLEGRPSDWMMRYASLHHAALTWPKLRSALAIEGHTSATDGVHCLHVSVASHAAWS
jgi:hypothetical protein